jgi:hypothetical protein
MELNVIHTAMCALMRNVTDTSKIPHAYNTACAPLGGEQLFITLTTLFAFYSIKSLIQ